MNWVNSYRPRESNFVVDPSSQFPLMNGDGAVGRLFVSMLVQLRIDDVGRSIER